MGQVLVVLVNFPQTSDVAAIGTALVSGRLAACVNILPAVQSIFRWQGQLEMAVETTMICKTTWDRYPALESALRAAHPYDTPEIIAIPVAAGFPAYLSWVVGETQHDIDV